MRGKTCPRTYICFGHKCSTNTAAMDHREHLYKNMRTLSSTNRNQIHHGTPNAHASTCIYIIYTGNGNPSQTCAVNESERARVDRHLRHLREAYLWLGVMLSVKPRGGVRFYMMRLRICAIAIKRLFFNVYSSVFVLSAREYRPDASYPIRCGRH